MYVRKVALLAEVAENFRHSAASATLYFKGIIYELTLILFKRQFRSILMSIFVNSKKLLLLPK